jgi:antirestriction protein ArdC
MSRSTTRSRSGGDRTNFYDGITNTIIAELEKGRFPWVQPWDALSAKAQLAMPKNASTNRAYSGINVLILWGEVIEKSYTAQSWLTFRQALALGGHVRKGERGTTVVYADRFIPDDARRRAAQSGGEARAIPFLKRFTVFNTDQIDDLPDEIATVAPPPPPGTIEPRVEALIKATGIDFRIGGNRAFYNPSQDYVQVPPPPAFFEPINWHRTALHELGHASGHSSRPVRFLRIAQVCLRGTGRGDERRVLLRFARYRADRPTRRLPRILARGAPRGQSRHRACCVARQQGR